MNKYILLGVLAVSFPLMTLASETDQSTATMSQDQRNYIMQVNCDSFTGSSHDYCLQKKREIMSQRPSTPPYPPRDGSGSTVPPPREGDVRPPHDVWGSGTDMPRPPRDGSGTVTRPPMRDGTGATDRPPMPRGSGMTLPPPAQNPPSDSISAGIAKLSDADRRELMTMIQKYLESKGITVKFPPAMTNNKTTGAMNGQAPRPTMTPGKGTLPVSDRNPMNTNSPQNRQ